MVHKYTNQMKAALEALGVSYYALMVNSNDNTFAQNSYGRPTFRQLEELRMYGELKCELRQLRNGMLMKDGSEILFSLSLGNTDMHQVAHMFLGVIHVPTYLCKPTRGDSHFHGHVSPIFL